MSAPIEPQFAFSDFCPIAEAVEKLATESDIHARGAIYTKREVVDFILDLTGYTTDAPLTNYRLLEPSFGNGDFLLPAVERLLKSAMRRGVLSCDVLVPAVRSIELHHSTFKETQMRVADLLCKSGLSCEDAGRICNAWLLQGDFLLTEFEHTFTHVVGNPPYVRQEAISDILLAEYRMRYKTIYDRADIYVPFIERSLELLEEAGQLGFICADRWMKNKYGKKLRALIGKKYTLTTYVDMNGVDAFHSEVNAYPAIIVIKNIQNDKTRVFSRPNIDAEFLKSLSFELKAENLPKKSKVYELDNVTASCEPWILDSFDELALVRRLESQFPAIEDVGCKVGIGVATGADKAFIGDFEDLEVESSRKLPLVMTGDICSGNIVWRGKGVVNPFGNDGKLVKIESFPMLRTYLEDRKEQIISRHIAEKNPHSWYRTIDRICPVLAYREKLLIPDIKGDSCIVHEKGRFYPHHNLYYITSDEWEVDSLQAIMCSGIARLFVSLYCTRMRGGYLRFQAQYLRKIRIPRWQNVSVDLRQSLSQYAQTKDHRTLCEITSELYGLTSDELSLLKGKNK